jgi:TolA-binding protein
MPRAVKWKTPLRAVAAAWRLHSRPQTMAASAWLVLLAVSLAPGCFWTTTRREGDALRADVRALRGRVDRHERGLDGEMQALRDSLKAAAGGLRRNTANLGADLAAFEAEARALRGRISALELAIERERTERAAAMATVGERLAALEGTGRESATPDALWRRASAAFEAGRWAEARESFGRVAAGDAAHPRADDAQYFLAETLRREERWEAAIREYRRLFDERGTSSFADDALFRAGESALRLLQCTEARTYFHLVRSRYPGSKLAAAASRQEQAIKAERRNRTKCRS